MARYLRSGYANPNGGFFQIRLGQNNQGKGPARVVVRDSLGEKVEIESVDTNGLVNASFSRQPEFTQTKTLDVPTDAIDPAKFPATVWIRVKKPCERSVHVTIKLEASGH